MRVLIITPWPLLKSRNTELPYVKFPSSEYPLPYAPLHTSRSSLIPLIDCQEWVIADSGRDLGIRPPGACGGRLRRQHVYQADHVIVAAVI